MWHLLDWYATLALLTFLAMSVALSVALLDARRERNELRAEVSRLAIENGVLREQTRSQPTIERDHADDLRAMRRPVPMPIPGDGDRRPLPRARVVIRRGSA